MDRALEARDTRLATMFAIFTLLTKDDGPPRTERLTHGPSKAAARLRAPIRWAAASAAIPVLLVAGLMAAIIALGIVTSGWTTCPSATGLHRVGPAKGAVCRSSANG